MCSWTISFGIPSLKCISIFCILIYRKLILIIIRMILFFYICSYSSICIKWNRIMIRGKDSSITSFNINIFNFLWNKMFIITHNIFFFIYPMCKMISRISNSCCTFSLTIISIYNFPININISHIWIITPVIDRHIISFLYNPFSI